MSGMMTLQQAADWLMQSGMAVKVVGDASVCIARIHTDTRSLQPGDLFVAIKGERYDANAFFADAKELGASAAIGHHGLEAAGLPGLEVADTKLALGRLAACWRAQFGLPLIAVTGSNGKTTVTQMIASILKHSKREAGFSTEGNLNNDIGVPLTLMRLTPAHEVGVVELGMNHPGEIAYLADLVRPAVALVNNAQREHLEFMATVQAVAHENGCVISALDSSGVAVFPADDDYSAVWRQLAAGRRVMTFAAPGSPAGIADVMGDAEWIDGSWQVAATTPAGPLEFRLDIAGRHNVKNAFAAIAGALAVAVPLSDIAAGLADFVPVKGRSRAISLVVGQKQISLVDDSYNSNPDSMRAAIDVLAELPGPRLLVMGDMGEVGDQGPQFHAEAGLYARQSGIDKLFTLGPQSALAAGSFSAGQHFDDIASLCAAVLAELPAAASVLVKGSRFMKMERVVDAIAAVAQSQNQIGETSHAA